MLAVEYGACKGGLYDMVALETLQLRKTAQQVSNGDSVLAWREPGIKGVYPFLCSPSPKRSFALGHLAQKEKQNVLPAIRVRMATGTFLYSPLLTVLFMFIFSFSASSCCSCHRHTSGVSARWCGCLLLCGCGDCRWLGGDAPEDHGSGLLNGLQALA